MPDHTRRLALDATRATPGTEPPPGATLMHIGDGTLHAADGRIVGRFSRWHAPAPGPVFVHAITGAADFLLDGADRRYWVALFAPQLLTLRRQAHRKGRPGWRAIRHPRQRPTRCR